MKKGKYGLISILLVSWITAGLIAMTPARTLAVTKVTFWHSLSGKRLPALNRIVEGFNQKHADIQVEAQFMGKSSQVLAKVIAAVGAKHAALRTWSSISPATASDLYARTLYRFSTRS